MKNLNKKTIIVALVMFGLGLMIGLAAASPEQNVKAENKPTTSEVTTSSKDANGNYTLKGYEEVDCVDTISTENGLMCQVPLQEEDENVRIFRGQGSWHEHTTVPQKSYNYSGKAEPQAKTGESKKANTAVEFSTSKGKICNCPKPGTTEHPYEIPYVEPKDPSKDVLTGGGFNPAQAPTTPAEDVPPAYNKDVHLDPSKTVNAPDNVNPVSDPDA